MENGQEKAARAGTLRGLDFGKLRQAEDSTPAGGEFKRPGKLRIMESEASALERGAAILAESTFSGPAVEQLGRALELVLRAEAERKRLKLRNGKSLAQLFPDTERAAA